jgi:hypothetical protein
MRSAARDARGVQTNHRGAASGFTRVLHQCLRRRVSCARVCRRGSAHHCSPIGDRDLIVRVPVHPENVCLRNDARFPAERTRRAMAAAPQSAAAVEVAAAGFNF